ncbi:class II aldolase/adducin family protein [Sphingosinicella ginsenosidimutans]|uniref:Class II aldolase/adducin family protein n=1 Tax=Allosphingosinicella ginsenosidimutans TaxID=1176539 RepID=A0A5C6TV86_9SPHN|nr:class II aldolase/adducin family protein [Sphingosinicella ginsenosidimutans]TXC64040.1 class II aldolase/adducin family protein [Sphingosinicella ginsenosidimutans]
MGVSVLSPSQHSFSDEDYEVRKELAACYRLAHHYRMTDLIATHISARLPGPGHRILINPFGALFNEVKASNLVEVTLDGEVLTPGGEINPAGYLIHSTIHAARPDVLCVMHTHTAAGVAVSAQEEGLLPISQQALVIGKRVAYHDYEGVALVESERVSLARDLGDKSVLILRNHGLLTAGRTIGEAFWLMMMTQRACEIQIAALAGGVPVRRLSREIQDLVDSQVVEGAGGRPGGALDWIALTREVKRIAPDYAD